MESGSLPIVVLFSVMNTVDGKYVFEKELIFQTERFNEFCGINLSPKFLIRLVLIGL